MELTARQQIAAYLSATFILSWLFEWYIVRAVGSAPGPMTIALTWIPGAAAIICSWIFGHEFEDLPLRLPLPKYWVFAYGVPAGGVLVTLVIAVAIGAGDFAFYGSKSLIRSLFFLPTFGVILSAIPALGAEAGWRGFLHARVKEAGIPAPYVFTGLLWSAWHWPLVLFGGFTHSRLPLFSLFLFTLTMTSMGVFLAWLRERTRSLLPPVLAHAVHLTWLNSVLPGFYKPGALSPYFAGEAGFILAVYYILFAAYLLHREEGFLQV